MFLDSNNEKIMVHILDTHINSNLPSIKKYWPQYIKDEKLINEIYNEYRLIFCNHSSQMSHIVYEYTNKYKNKLLTPEQRNKYLDEKTDFYHKLNIYIKQFYPDFSFLKLVSDKDLGLNELFNTCYETIEKIERIFTICRDLNSLRDYNKALTTIIKFYSIIEEFVIRYYNYSIVGISNQKYIITSSNNCDKDFIKYLMQGYSLIRLKKIYLVNNSHYEFLPSLPTKDIGCKFDEFIEIEDENKTNKLVKVI